MKKRYFNLIEVLLAMGVISIGFAGLIMPVIHGWDMERKAQEKFYVTLAAENLAAWMKANKKTFGQHSGQTMRTMAAAYKIDMTDGYGGRGAGEAGLQPPFEKEDGNWRVRVYPDENGPYQDFPEYFEIYRDMSQINEYSTSGRGCYCGFLATFYTEIRGERVKEFECMLMMGTMTETLGTSSADNRNTHSSGNTIICMNVSWPASEPPKEREKKYFTWTMW